MLSCNNIAPISYSQLAREWIFEFLWHGKYHKFWMQKTNLYILAKNRMGFLWQSLDLTTGQHHNIGFPKRDGLSIQKLHSKPVMIIWFAVPLNFLNKPLFWGPANRLLFELAIFILQIDRIILKLPLQFALHIKASTFAIRRSVVWYQGCWHHFFFSKDYDLFVLKLWKTSSFGFIIHTDT